MATLTAKALRSALGARGIQNRIVVCKSRKDNPRPDGRGYFLAALRACALGFAVGLRLHFDCGVAAWAAEPTATAFPVAEPPFGAELAGIDREWNVSFRTGGKVRVIRPEELAYWGRWKDVEAGPQVLLSDGGVVRADVLLVDEKQVVVGDATGLGRGFWEESMLPRGAVRALMLQPPAAAAERDRLWKRLASGGGLDDVLILAGGETVSGTLVSAPRLGRFAPDDAKPGSEKFEIARRGGGQPISVPAGKVIAVQFGSAKRSTAGRASGGTQLVWIGFTGGSLVQAAAVSTRGEVVTVALAGGGELRTTLADRDEVDKRFWRSVSYLEPAGRRVAWLSDRESIGYKQIPFVSVQWPLGVDESVLGTKLRAAGTVFRKGIGMPSASRVACEVAGYRRFAAELAIDDAAGQGGSVVFKVVLQAAGGEWQAAFESPVVHGGDAPIPISVELKGASRMALLVEFAERGDVCDYADWLAPRLVK